MRNLFAPNPILVKLSLAALIGLALFLAGTGETRAQAQMWIQVESHNNIRDTRERAQAYAARYPATRAFATSTGWYAIVIGPFSRDEAERRLRAMRAERAVPADAFVYDGGTYQNQLWPLAAGNPQSGAVTVLEPGAGAEASAPRTTAAPTPEPPTIRIISDDDLRATQRFEASWSRERRMEFQRYLTWTGDYDDAIDGAYGPGTRGAIRAFQDREGYEATGYLTAGQTLVLRQRYRAITEPLGIAELDSREAGIAMLYPARLLQRDRAEPPFVHYQAAREQDVRMVLISQEGGSEVLASLYEIMETFDYVPATGDRELKRDWFVLSGEDDRMASYSYARVDDGLIKGFSLIWAKPLDRAMRRLAAMMRESFQPLPGLVLDESIGYGDDPDEPTDLSEGLDFEKPAYSASGFFVNAEGAMITDIANVRNCNRITVGDGIEMREAGRDRSGEMVLLKPVSAFAPAGYALFSDRSEPAGAEITVAGFSFPEVMEVATLNYGNLAGSGAEDAIAADLPDGQMQLSAYIEPGDFGGPVLDGRGAVIGMQMQRESHPDTPEFVNFAVKSDRITAFLAEQGLEYGVSRVNAPQDPVDIAMQAGDFTAKVSCWR